MSPNQLLQFELETITQLSESEFTVLDNSTCMPKSCSQVEYSFEINLQGIIRVNQVRCNPENGRPVVDQSLLKRIERWRFRLHRVILKL